MSAFKLVSVAAERFPHLQFRRHENYEIGGQEIFDYILIMDVNDQVDPIAALKALRPAMSERTRIIVHHYNHLWEPIIRLAERTGLKFPLPQQNWLSPGDLQNIFTLCDWERLQIRRAVLIPKYIPLLSTLANSFLSRLPVIQHLNMINLSIARPVGPREPVRDYSVSVIVPCSQRGWQCCRGGGAYPEHGPAHRDHLLRRQINRRHRRQNPISPKAQPGRRHQALRRAGRLQGAQRVDRVRSCRGRHSR